MSLGLQCNKQFIVFTSGWSRGGIDMLEGGVFCGNASRLAHLASFRSILIPTRHVIQDFYQRMIKATNTNSEI